MFYGFFTPEGSNNLYWAVSGGWLCFMFHEIG